jgi:hypothetical protein
MDAMTFYGFMGVVAAAGAIFWLCMALTDPSRFAVQEEQKRAVPVQPVVQSVAAVPAFFAKLPVNEPLPAIAGFDEGLLAFLENHVKAEQAMVTNFVHFPSVDSLYRPARPSPTMH